jgi:hypothetical protein
VVQACEHLRDRFLPARSSPTTGARFVLAKRGLGQLTAEFDFEDDEVADALTYADRSRFVHLVLLVRHFLQDEDR